MLNLFKKFRRVFNYREDCHAQLVRFLNSDTLIAKLCNFTLNLPIMVVKRFCMDPPPPPPQREPSPRVRTCTIIAEMGIQQCVHYRVLGRVAQLHFLGWHTIVRDWHDSEGARAALQLADCAIFYRIPMIEHVSTLFDEAKRLGLPILYDIDDLIFHKTELLKHTTKLQLEEQHALVMYNAADTYLEAIKSSDALLASTAGLAQYCGEVPCHVVHNALPEELVLMAQTIPEKHNHGEAVHLFYGSGTDTHDADFNIVAEALYQVMQEDPRLHLHIHGQVAVPEILLPLAQRIHLVPFLDERSYYRICADYDIALTPLLPDAFNNAKSNIKYLEASALGIPSVVSPAAEFNAIIEDGVNGFIASTTEEWRDKILLLATDPLLREKMGQAARQSVLTQYAFDAIANNELLPTLPPPSTVKRERILLVNVIFGQRSMGGAALVARETALELQKHGYDLYVFSREYNKTFPHCTLMHHYWHNISIFSVNALPNDKKLEKESDIHFCDILRYVQPAIVHFHAIEGMGNDLMNECIRQGIPYVITIHDAWWVCPRQFMLDPTGQYCDQSVVDMAHCHVRCGIKETALWQRTSHMREAVAGAHIVFTPSDFYTNFIRNNFPRYNAIITNRNGILLPQVHSASRLPGPLRFGYLGGRAHWKGYFFLAKALRNLARDDYELLLLDLATVFGSGEMAKETESVWQGVPVYVIPFVPHEEIDSLYAQIDVLLFPSLLDESFGLTVREAIAHDVFVISSECGGPSEAIINGMNGFIFPKGDMMAFNTLLQQILDDQETYKNYTTSCQGDIRSFAVQAVEIAAAYKRILDN